MRCEIRQRFELAQIRRPRRAKMNCRETRAPKTLKAANLISSAAYLVGASEPLALSTLRNVQIRWHLRSARNSPNFQLPCSSSTSTDSQMGNFLSQHFVKSRGDASASNSQTAHHYDDADNVSAAAAAAAAHSIDETRAARFEKLYGHNAPKFDIQASNLTPKRSSSIGSSLRRRNSRLSAASNNRQHSPLGASQNDLGVSEEQQQLDSSRISAANCEVSFNDVCHSGIGSEIVEPLINRSISISDMKDLENLAPRTDLSDYKTYEESRRPQMRHSGKKIHSTGRSARGKLQQEIIMPVTRLPLKDLD